jgi:hypothetical protein
MEFQMRNKTFISSMVMSVACVSAANAGVVDPFSVNPSKTASTNGIALVTNSYAYSGGLFDTATMMVQTQNSSTTASATSGTGSLALSTSPRNTGNGTSSVTFGMQYSNANQSSVNMTGLVDFSITVGAIANFGTNPQIRMYVTDNNNGNNWWFTSLVSIASNTTYRFLAADFIKDDGSGGVLNWASDVKFLGLEVLRSTGGTASASSSMQLSNFTYTVPAPGALALLGVAGRVGGRRRRA